MAKKLVIRDDDTCYFTQPLELSDIYRNLYELGIKVTLSVIPETTGEFRTVSLSSEPSNKKMKVWQNHELLQYINHRKSRSEVDIVLHGLTHEYQFSDRVVAELKWKDPKIAEVELETAIKSFRQHFGKEIKSFVPPSNALSRDVARIIAAKGLNISGVIEVGFNRPVSVHSIINYICKISYKLITRRTIPYVLNYGSHKELTFYNLTPSSNIDELYNSLYYCARKKLPFVLSTHYWELRDNESLRIHLHNLVNTALDLGYDPAFLDEVF